MTVPRDGKSSVSGDRSEPLRDATIPEVLAQTVSDFGSRDAAVCCEQNKRLSYSDLDREVDALASGFLAIGLEKGDRIGIWSPNRLEWLLTQFATARIGLVMVNINPAYRLVELEYALYKVGCKALVTAASFKSSHYIDMLGELAPELVHCEPGRLHAAKLPELRTIIQLGDDKTSGMFNFQDVMEFGGSAELQRLDAISASLKPDDPINIQFTSGTTGTPKGATLSHFNIVNNAHFSTRTIKFTETDGCAFPCRSTIVSAWSWARSAVSRKAPVWSFPAKPSTRVRPWPRSRRNGARRSMVCRPCLSRCLMCLVSPASTCRRLGRASWPGRRARSRS